MSKRTINRVNVEAERREFAAQGWIPILEAQQLAGMKYPSQAYRAATSYEIEIRLSPANQRYKYVRRTDWQNVVNTLNAIRAENLRVAKAKTERAQAYQDRLAARVAKAP